jgi:hypothetical protein
MASLSFRASTDTDAQSITQVIINTPLIDMATDDRKALGSGPMIALMVGQILIADNIPKRAAMGFSEELNKILTNYPRSSMFMLNPEQVHEDHVRTLVDFIVGNSHVHRPFSLQKPGTFSECAKLYNHALMFGMGRYAGGLRKTLLDEINSDTITSYCALDELVKLPKTDRCYVTLVHKFEGLMHIGELEGDDDWTAWLTKHPDFLDQMNAWNTVRMARKAEAAEARRADL